MPYPQSQIILPHNLGLDVVWTQMGREWSWPASKQSCRHLYRQCMWESPHGNHFSNYLLWGRTCTQGQWSLIKHYPQGFYSKNWEALPHYQQGSDIHRAESKFYIISPTGFTFSNTNCTLLSDKGQYTLRKDMTGVYTKTSPCTKDFGHTHSVQSCSNIETNPQGHSKVKWKGRGIIRN